MFYTLLVSVLVKEIKAVSQVTYFFTFCKWYLSVYNCVVCSDWQTKDKNYIFGLWLKQWTYFTLVVHVHFPLQLTNSLQMPGCQQFAQWGSHELDWWCVKLLLLPHWYIHHIHHAAAEGGTGITSDNISAHRAHTHTEYIIRRQIYLTTCQTEQIVFFLFPFL